MAIKYPYTFAIPAKNPTPGREYMYVTMNADGSKMTSYGSSPDPKDATDLGSKTSAAKPESKPKAEPKAKPTVDSAVKGAAKPATKPLSKLDLVSDVDAKNLNRTSILPNAVRKAGSIYKAAGNWLKNTKIGGYFADSPLTPMNVALTHKSPTGGLNIKGWRIGWRAPVTPVAHAINAYNMGGSGGYIPLGENTVDKLRIQHGKDELSNQGTTVPINPQGTQYLDPELGIVDTQVLKDEDGICYYRNAQTGQFEPLDYNTNDTYISADQLARNNIAKAKAAKFNKTADYLNDIISGVIKNIPQDISKLPLPSKSADTTETKPTQPVVKPKRVVRPPVVNNTPAANVTPVQPPVTNTNTPVAAPTLSSVVPQAVRHNGGFDNYRRESVLSALRAAGGISPAEAVQRGIIPWEALNYV